MSLTDVVSSLINAINASSFTPSLLKGATNNITTNLSSNAPLNTITAPDAANTNIDRPKAYLTILFFDERFNFIEDGSYSKRIESAGAAPGGSSFLANGMPQNIKAPKNGYCYVYLSNQSDEPVYFDNLQVSDIHGRLIEENHYYPYGLKISTISSKKILDANEANNIKNNYLYNDKELFDDGDLNWYDYGFRNYDPQIGRFTQADPYDQFPSPYTGMGNDPINNVDPSGGWSLASITGSTNILFNTSVTTIGGALVGGIVGMATGDDKGWLNGAAVGAAVGLGVSFKADLNVVFDIFRTGLQIENRIIGRSLNDLGDKLINAEDKLNRRNKKDRDDFKNHFGVDDDNSMDLIKGRVLKEQNLVKEYLKKRTYKSKIKRTNVYGPGTFAFVNPADPNHNVNLEPAFWKANRKGQDSKMGTIAHELSHFNDIGGTGDNGYGVTNARNLTSTPANALNNADNFEYYIEKVKL